MKFVIRDDDLNYFSTPGDIIRWYADIFAQGIPVGFATIPLVKPISDVYTADVLKEDREYPISTNSELVAYIKSNPLIEIVQHGTTHETKNDVFEYAGHVPLGEAGRGKNELTYAFGVPSRVFAAPHDWINSAGVLSVEGAGMDIIRGRGAGLKNIIFRKEYIATFFKMVWFKLKHLFSGNIPAYPYVLNFGHHKEVCSYRLQDIDIFDGLTYAHKKGGIFVVVTHVHGFTPEKKEKLMKLIECAREFGAEFIYPSNLFI